MARVVTASSSAIPQWQIDASRFAILSRLAADLVHGIKNPLNSMVINLHVLGTRAERGDTHAVRERAAILEHEIRRLNALIEVLSGLLRPEKDREGPTSVSRIIDELGLLLELRTKDARVDFSQSSLQVDAYTSVRAYALRFGLLAVADLIFDLARQAGAAMWLTADPEPAEIHVRIGYTGDAAALRTTSLQAMEDSGSLRGIPVASAMLEPAGGIIEIEDGRPVVLIRIPRFV